MVPLKEERVLLHRNSAETLSPHTIITFLRVDASGGPNVQPAKERESISNLSGVPSTLMWMAPTVAFCEEEEQFVNDAVESVKMHPAESVCSNTLPLPLVRVMLINSAEREEEEDDDDEGVSIVRVLNDIRGASPITIPSNTTPLSITLPFFASINDEESSFDSSQVNFISLKVTSEDEDEGIVRKTDVEDEEDEDEEEDDTMNVMLSKETFPFETVNTLPVERGDTLFEIFSPPTN